VELVEHTGLGSLTQPGPDGGRRAAANLLEGSRAQGGGAGHEQQRGGAYAVTDAAMPAAVRWAQWWGGATTAPGTHPAVARGESRMLDSPEGICACQARSKYSATPVPFSTSFFIEE
jgi:hypothetical protein